MAPSTTPTDQERTYTVSWRKPDGESNTCKNLTPRIAFARLWAAWKSAGEITVTAVIPEWIIDPSFKTDTWPYAIQPPDCQDANHDGWTCITHDGTGFWCSACILWSEENGALVESGEAST